MAELCLNDAFLHFSCTADKPCKINDFQRFVIKKVQKVQVYPTLLTFFNSWAGMRNCCTFCTMPDFTGFKALHSCTLPALFDSFLHLINYSDNLEVTDVRYK